MRHHDGCAGSAGSRGRRLLRATAHVGLVLAIVTVSAVTVQAGTERSQRAVYAAPGRLVDVGGGELIHLRTWGVRRAGEAAIVLDVSAGTPSSAWAWVGQMLGQRRFVVAYDRPGMAWSTGPKRPRDAVAAATALSRALAAAQIEPPYVVVAHSYGGFSARAFVGMHMDDVAGVVLLDTTHHDGAGGPVFAAQYRLSALRAHAGAFALLGTPNVFGELPPEERDAANAVSHWTSHLDTAAEELEAWPASAAHIRHLRLGSLPLLVVAAAGSPEHDRLQRDLVSLSTRSSFVQLPVDHMGMLIDRDGATLTAQTIDDFLNLL